MRKFFDKFLSPVLAAVFALTVSCALLTACEPRDEVLKIYNWGEYMDPDVYEGFSDWYYKETGRTVRVKYKEFDTNESMFTEISVNKSDYDLVCPSDYMIQRMIAADLLIPLDETIFEATPDLYYEGLTERIDRSFDPGLKYTVPYVWGTFGIMYDVTKAKTPEDFRSWNAMFSEKYKKQILMKNSVRDAYSIAQIYNSRELLAEKSNNFTDYNADYYAALESIFSDIDKDKINAARETLVKQKDVLIRYEVDDGKDDMLSGNTDAVLGFFWSCDAGYVMNDSVIDATGCAAERVTPGNKNLFYVVPEEGANVWVDGFVIPKYARNVTAANYFLKYLCYGEYSEDDEYFEDYGSVAEKNMDWLGTSVAVKAAMDSMLEYYEEGADGFFDDAPEGFKEMYLDMVFPSPETLSRCAIMKDYGEYNFELDGMWIDVKTS
ncbi:MAG: extracellular solute-binding protein [Clostridia bacterium]|nr:extracellular solute-binding protein [Clostridia bacterium]